MDRTASGLDLPRKAFTLIELLVVITIIVILLALLMPALDQALYQADLTICGSRLKSIATGAVQYAMANKQFFPYRNAVETKALIGGSLTNTGDPAGQGQNTGTVFENTPGYRFRRVNTLREGKLDDRGRIRDYISMKSLLDPMCGEIDLTTDDPANTNYVYSNYALFFGMSYERWGSMRKMGKRMQITDHWLSSMACDLDIYNVKVPGKIKSISTHPDKDGVMALQVRDNVGGVMDSMWLSLEKERGKIDFNQSMWDGSTVRCNDIVFAQCDQDETDYFSDGTWQADSTWTSGDFEFFGEYSRGDGTSKARDPYYVNPDGL
jgi:prepilin-type N-terminal cleavage/methylation domain-containing protein